MNIERQLGSIIVKHLRWVINLIEARQYTGIMYSLDKIIVKHVEDDKSDEIIYFLASDYTNLAIRYYILDFILDTKKKNEILLSDFLLTTFDNYQTRICDKTLSTNRAILEDFFLIYINIFRDTKAFLIKLKKESKNIEFKKDKLATIRSYLKQGLDISGFRYRDFQSFLINYRNRVVEIHGEITPPSFDKERREDIDKIYVSPNFEPRPHSFLDFNIKKINQDSLSLFINDIYRTVLLGDPGGGKSTCAQKICYDLALQNTMDFVLKSEVPILVILRDYAIAFKKNDCSILEFIEQILASTYQLPIEDGYFEYLLNTGSAVVIFDGLDELTDSSQRRKIRTCVEAFSYQYLATSILVTSRKIGYEEAPLKQKIFNKYSLLPFDTNQTQQYVENWFTLDYPSRDAKWQHIVDSFMDESRNLRDLRSNSLMLALLCNIYKKEGYIPRNRPDVYEKCSEMLFQRWDKGRSINLPPKVEEIESKVIRLMEYLANWIYDNPELQSGVSEISLIVKVREYLYPQYLDDEEKTKGIAKEFVYFCRGRAWVFTGVGIDSNEEELYKFTHRTFLEYFTAKNLVSTNPNSDDLYDLLMPSIRHQQSDIINQLAFKIRDKQTEGAGSDLLEKLCNDIERSQELIEVQASFNSELYFEMWSMLSFALRSLEFIAPRIKIIKLATKLLISELIRLRIIVKTDRYQFGESGYKSDVQPTINQTITVTNQFAKENINSFANALKENISSALTSSDRQKIAAAYELSHLNEYKIAKYSEKIYEEKEFIFSSSLKEISQQDLMVCKLSFWKEQYTLTEIINWHGVASIFLNINSSYLYDLSYSSIAMTTFETFIYSFSELKEEQLNYCLNSLADFGKIFLESDTLSINFSSSKENSYFIHNNPLEHLLGYQQWQDNGDVLFAKMLESVIAKNDILFGAIIIFAIFIEIQFGNNFKQSNTTEFLRAYILNKKTPFFFYVSYICLARLESTSGFTRSYSKILKNAKYQLDQCGFTSKQKKLLERWINKEINFIAY